MLNVDCASRTDTLMSKHGMLCEIELTHVLEDYVTWLASEYEGTGFNLTAHHFDLSGYRSQLRGHVSAGELAESEASRYLFLAALLRAHKMSQVIVDNNVAAAKIRRLTERLSIHETTCDNKLNEIDENELRSVIIHKHTEKWRELSSRSGSRSRQLRNVY